MSSAADNRSQFNADGYLDKTVADVAATIPMSSSHVPSKYW